MIKVILDDLSNFVVTDERDIHHPVEAYGEHCKEGDNVYVEKSLNHTKQRLLTVHEILELNFPRTNHGKLDKVAIDIIDGLLQLKRNRD